MKDEGGDHIDLLFSRDENIVPSSGFTASVMDAVARHTTAPPPIPFPWKRALPGLGWCLAVAIAFLTMAPASSGNPPSAPAAAGLSTVLTAVGWIAAALVLTIGSVAFSVRMARRT